MEDGRLKGVWSIFYGCEALMLDDGNLTRNGILEKKIFEQQTISHVLEFSITLNYVIWSYNTTLRKSTLVNIIILINCSSSES